MDPTASAANAYPLGGLTFLLLPKQPQDASTAAKVKAFVGYVISDGRGQAQQLYSAPLPSSFPDINQRVLDQVQGGS